MTKPANMTDRELQSLRNEGHDEAADEIEHLALDLQTERAAVVALQATVAGLRKSAALRAQHHAAELADVIAERDHAVEQAAKNADEVLRLREQVTEMREICKLGFRALDAAGTALLTIEPESSAEQEPMSDLLQQVHDVALSMFTVARLPVQEATRAFYGKAAL